MPFIVGVLWKKFSFEGRRDNSCKDKFMQRQIHAKTIHAKTIHELSLRPQKLS